MQIDIVKSFLLHLQHRLCDVLNQQELRASFLKDDWQTEKGTGITAVLENGEVIERSGVNFSHVHGDHLPQAATLKRPDLAGAKFQAMGISSVTHPRNPFVPTAHLNVRYFQAEKQNGESVWWFGGGFDLTPYYAFEEDCIHFHRTAKNICDQSHPEFYKQFKKNADDYFYLKHRHEARGIGGIFFDDVNALGFENSFNFLKNVGNGFIDAYLPIVEKRKSHEYTPKQRDFQLMRRGRYVEFNLIHDRGTLFGLQFGSRTESLLVSMPPQVSWEYQFQPEKNSTEEKLINEFLKPRSWV